MAIEKILLDQLNDPKLIAAGGYINGQFVTEAKSGKIFTVTNPATGELLATLPDMDVEETRSAIDNSYVAQKAWAKEPAKVRSSILKKLHGLFLEHVDDLAKILTLEMGKPLAEAKGEILYGASYIEWFAEEAKRAYGETIPAPSSDQRVVVSKQPIGVVASITPWNFPNAMLARKMAPALAAGCAIVAKPAELTPLSAIAIGELCTRAGIPAGLYNLVVSTNSPDVGQALCTSDKIRKMTFTGSTGVGKILMRQCADQIMKMSLELGGNAPFIVFDDADIDAAVEGAMISKYRNAGQTCVCANRLYVQEGVYDEFAQKLAAKVEALNIGNGMNEGVNIGPMIETKGLQKVEEHIEDAVSKGASVLTGGKPHDAGGLFFQPTIIANVDKSMKVAREETFGPVAPLFKFKDEADVIAQANDTEFGLASYFYARDMSRVWRVAEELEYGMVGINTGLISNEAAPFGGMKQSGLGREGSRHGLEDYMEMKYMCFGGVNA
jgi:succinate-semialdehyde dehydrogenase/glutarate-semialdehyde dehydrogenase